MPTYVNDRDERKEVFVAKQLRNFKGWDRYKFQKLPKHDNFDLALMDGRRVVSMIEIRCRDITVEQYLDVYCGADKIIKAKALAIPCLFVVWFEKSNRIGYRIMGDPDSYTVGKNYTRNDPNDNNLTGLYRVEKFNFFEVTDEA